MLMSNVVVEIVSAPRKLSRIPIGAVVVVGLRGGGVVDGVLRRRVSRAIVVGTTAGEVVVLEAATWGVRVRTAVSS